MDLPMLGQHISDSVMLVYIVEISWYPPVHLHTLSHTIVQDFIRPKPHHQEQSASERGSPGPFAVNGSGNPGFSIPRPRPLTKSDSLSRPRKPPAPSRPTLSRTNSVGKLVSSFETLEREEDEFYAVAAALRSGGNLGGFEHQKLDQNGNSAAPPVKNSSVYLLSSNGKSKSGWRGATIIRSRDQGQGHFDEADGDIIRPPKPPPLSAKPMLKRIVSSRNVSLKRSWHSNALTGYLG